MLFTSLLVQAVMLVTLAKSGATLIIELKEHLGKDKNTQILKHLQENRHCGQVSNFDCFDVINCDTSHFRLQLKEAMRITWKKPILNKQIKHITLTISISVAFFVYFYFLYSILFLVFP